MTESDDEFARKHIENVVYVTRDLGTLDDPSAKTNEAIRVAMLKRLQSLGIQQPMMQADLIGNSVTLPENMARQYFEVSAEDVKEAILRIVKHGPDGPGASAEYDVINSLAEYCMRKENLELRKSLLDVIDETGGVGGTPLPEKLALRTDVTFQNLIESYYYSAEKEIATILQRPQLRGIDPDTRFPQGLVEYYRDHCQNNQFASFNFVCEDGLSGKKLELTAPEVQNVIKADLRMIACQVVLKTLGMEDSPILKKSGHAEGR